MNNDKNFNLLCFVLLVIFMCTLLMSSWETYLHYLNRKQIIEAIKDKDPKYVNEQMQGLMNDIKKMKEP